MAVDTFQTYTEHMLSTVGGPNSSTWVDAAKRLHEHIPIETWPRSMRDLFNCCRFIKFSERYKLYTFLYGNAPGDHVSKAQDTHALMLHMLRDESARHDVRVNLPKAMFGNPERHEYFDVHHGLICSIGGNSTRYTGEAMYNAYMAMEWERYAYACSDLSRRAPAQPDRRIADWASEQMKRASLTSC